MPIYEYACSCGKNFEVVVTRESDKKGIKCPKCEGRKVKRLMSAPHKAVPGLHEYRKPDKKKVY
jgi:putative FmdB family regulatory protein